MSCTSRMKNLDSSCRPGRHGNRSKFVDVLPTVPDDELCIPYDIQTGSKRLKQKKWRSAFDAEGRLTQMPKLIRTVMEGGVDESIRSEVWEFLLGCYSIHSTHEERKTMREARRSRYEELVEQCRQMHSSMGSGQLAYTVGNKILDARSADAASPSPQGAAREGKMRVSSLARLRQEALSASGSSGASMRLKSLTNSDFAAVLQEEEEEEEEEAERKGEGGEAVELQRKLQGRVEGGEEERGSGGGRTVRATLPAVGQSRPMHRRGAHSSAWSSIASSYYLGEDEASLAGDDVGGSDFFFDDDAGDVVADVSVDDAAVVRARERLMRLEELEKAEEVGEEEEEEEGSKSSVEEEEEEEEVEEVGGEGEVAEGGGGGVLVGENGGGARLEREERRVQRGRGWQSESEGKKREKGAGKWREWESESEKQTRAEGREREWHKGAEATEEEEEEEREEREESEEREREESESSSGGRGRRRGGGEKHEGKPQGYVKRRTASITFNEIWAELGNGMAEGESGRNGEEEEEGKGGRRKRNGGSGGVLNPVVALGLDVTEERVAEWLWTLHKIVVDVVRTDQHLEFFQTPSNMARLSDILAVHAWIDPETGYCQGMADLVSPFVILFDNNADAFWCFECLVSRVRHNFLAEGPVGVMRQLVALRTIIALTDADLLQRLQFLEADTFMFAFRMLLVLFRRELPFADAIIMWEMMWAADFDTLQAQVILHHPPKALALNNKIDLPLPTTGIDVLPAEELAQGPLFKGKWRRGSLSQKPPVLSRWGQFRDGDEDISVFCVAAILQQNRRKLMKELEEAEDAIKMFNDVEFTIDVHLCVQSAIKLRTEYLRKLTKIPKNLPYKPEDVR